MRFTRFDHRHALAAADLHLAAADLHLAAADLHLAALEG